MATFSLAMNKIPHDKLWVKYVGYQHDPYGQWLQYFKENKEYTHIAICPDDIMLHAKGVRELWSKAQNGHIVSAMVNVSKNDFECPYRTSWTIACTKNLPSLKFPRNYDWYTMGELDKLRNGSSLVPVPHTGVAFMILTRSLVEKISFKGDRGSLNDAKPSAYDVGISHDLNDMGIKQYVDTDVFIAHFRYGSEIQNGKKEPHLIVDKWGKEQEKKPLYDLVPFDR